jgi:hypothetical protein
MTSDADYSFENVIIGWTWIAQMERNKYVTQMNIRFGEVVKSKLLQKITCERKAEPVNFSPAALAMQVATCRQSQS